MHQRDKKTSNKESTDYLPYTPSPLHLVPYFPNILFFNLVWDRETTSGGADKV